MLNLCMSLNLISKLTPNTSTAFSSQIRTFGQRGRQVTFGQKVCILLEDAVRPTWKWELRLQLCKTAQDSPTDNAVQPALHLLAAARFLSFADSRSFPHLPVLNPNEGEERKKSERGMKKIGIKCHHCPSPFLIAHCNKHE